MSQCHHLSIGVLSMALVEVVNHSAQARNPPTGDMVVACALWRRELTPLTGNVHHPTLADAVAGLPGRG